VGIKTTVALVARDGVIPISEPQDSIGPMARTVKDAAHMLSAMAGKSPYDKRTSTIPFEKIPDYAAACHSTSLTGMRIGIPRNSFDDVGPAVMKAFENAIKVLTGAGATMIENADYVCMEEWRTVVDTDEFWSICEADFNEAIENTCQNLVENPNNIRTLEGIIEFTKKCPEEEYPKRDILRWEYCQRARSLPAEELRKRRERSLRCSKEEGILGAIKTHKLNALIAPSFATASTTFAARAGLPVIAVPMGVYPADTPITKNKREDLVTTAPNIP
jgi:amidase